VILLVTPVGFAPVMRHARTLITGTARANVEFAKGVESVRQLEAPELSKMAEEGYPLQAAARALVVTYRAVQTVMRQEAARIAKRRERVAEKAQSARDAKREEAEREKRRVRAEKASEAKKAKKAEARQTAAPCAGLDETPSDHGTAPW
jgi:hypothetical protein